MDLYDSMLQQSSSNRLQRARVRSVPAQHSWAALPGPLVSKLLDSQAATPLVLKLLPALTTASQAAGRSPFSSNNSTHAAAAASLSTRPRYVAWGGGVSTSPGCIELPAHLASALQLPSGLEVCLEVVPRLAPASAVVLEPVGPADWEVVELNAGLLEEHVLGQVRGWVLQGDRGTSLGVGRAGEAGVRGFRQKYRGPDSSTGQAAMQLVCVSCGKAQLLMMMVAHVLLLLLCVSRVVW